MKKIIEWLKSPKSDFVLFIAILILANIALHNAHLRFDITKQGSYSLSASSKQTVKTLEDKLSVKVFFSDDLPSEYAGIYTYLKDILVEYKGAANKNFSYSFYNMKKAENAKIAQDYGLRQYQVQVFNKNERSVKQVWLGLVITYGNSIETIDGIQDQAGLEYKITTTIAKLVSTADALAGAGDKITVKLFATDELKPYGISGYDKIDSYVQNAFDESNKKLNNRLYFEKVQLKPEEYFEVSDKYGLQLFDLQDKSGNKTQAVFGLVIESGEIFRQIPLSIAQVRSLFGTQNVIQGIDNLEESISESVQALLSKTREIGYITGHDEAELTDADGKETSFVNLLSDSYELKKINLSDEDIPVNLTSIIINGPKTKYSDKELYKIDQFMMKGGNVIAFVDPFDMQVVNQYTAPTFTPIDSGLGKLFEKWGVKLENAYVMDENCYVGRQQTWQGVAQFSMYWAPMLSGKYLNQKHPVTKNLGYVIFLQPGQMDVTGAKENKNLKLTVLAKSSPESWTVKDNIQLMPNMGTPYDKSIEKSEPLAVLVEGKFDSAFDSNPDESAEKSGISASTHLAKGKQAGKLFVAADAYLTSEQLIQQSSEPVAIMVRNAVDYMNGNPDLCLMRSKGVSFQSLDLNTGFYPAFVEWFCIIGLAVIVAVCGLIYWKKRSLRRRQIHDTFNPNDSREMKASDKEIK